MANKPPNKRTTKTASRSRTGERKRDTQSLDQDIEESARESILQAGPRQRVTDDNWSKAQDRGEDLAEHRDPFVVPDEAGEIPPELIQKRAYQIFEARGYQHGEDLSHWFEAQQQLRRELKFHK